MVWNKGKKMTAAQKKKLSAAMSASYAERRARYGPIKGKSKGPHVNGWSPQMRAHFNATIAGRRKAREAAANGSAVAVVPHVAGGRVMEFPLDAIPERAPKRVTPRYSRMNGHAPDNQELATDLLRIAVAMLKGKL